MTTCKCEASYRLNRVPAQRDLFKVTDSLQQGGTKLNNQILDQTHLEGKWLYCVDSVVVKCDLFQVLQPLEGLKIYFPRTIWILEIFLFQVSWLLSLSWF